MRTALLILVAVSLGVAATLMVLPGRAEDKNAAKVPYAKDGENAKITRWNDLRGVRYMEFFLIGSEPVDGQIKGTCYNTTGLNMAEGSRDSCPQALVGKLDGEKLAKEFRVAKVYLNPPRQWLLDWLDIALGAEREFGGLKATWCAVLNVPRSVGKGKGPEPYKPATIARKSKFGFNKGSKVHLLDDPDGNTWIQKSLTQAVNRANTLENLDQIGSRLKLPEGWKSRMKVLDEDLILVPESGVARIVSDDLDDVYDVTGKGYSNYKP
jgi:hypothetical protein